MSDATVVVVGAAQARLSRVAEEALKSLAWPQPRPRALLPDEEGHALINDRVDRLELLSCVSWQVPEYAIGNGSILKVAVAIGHVVADTYVSSAIASTRRALVRRGVDPVVQADGQVVCITANAWSWPAMAQVLPLATHFLGSEPGPYAWVSFEGWHAYSAMTGWLNL